MLEGISSLLLSKVIFRIVGVFFKGCCGLFGIKCFGGNCFLDIIWCVVGR